MAHTERRKRIVNYSIKRAMQLRLLFKVMTIALLGVILTSVIFYVYSNKEIEGSFKQFHIMARDFLDYLLPAVLLALFIGIVVAAVFAVFFPGRIAGPLYRIEKNLKERVAEGDLTVRFNVRKGDEMGELADSLNVMIVGINGRLEKIKKPVEDLEDLLRGSKEGISLDKVSELAGTIGDAVREFKV